jgi:WD40 repeat protein
VTAALSDDARTLAVGSLSGDIQLWDLTDPGQPRTLGPPLTAATPDGLTPSAVLLDDAGQTLAAIGTDSTVAIWNLAPLADIRDHAVAHACMVTRAGLDHDEWVRFVPSLEYVDVCAP